MYSLFTRLCDCAAPDNMMRAIQQCITDRLCHRAVALLQSNVRGANENAKSQLPDAKSLAGAANVRM